MTWKASLKLDYTREGGRSVARFAHDGPLRILQSLWPEGDAICHNVLVKVGLPRSLPYFYGSLKIAITLAFVGTVLAEMTAGDSGIGNLIQSAGSQQRMPLAFAGLAVISIMAMAMYELFSAIEKHTTGWAHRGSQGQ